MKKLLLLSTLLAICCTPLSAEVFRAKQYEHTRFFYKNRIRIRSNKLGNWYVLGETVVFSSEHKFAPDDKIRAVLTDYEGSVYSDRTLSGKDFNGKGWSWKSDEPGYYEVKFYCNGKLLSEGWNQPIWKMDPKKNQYVEVGREKYERAVHGIVVTAKKTGKPAEFSEVFSLCDSLTKKTIEFASLIGFRGLRIHTVDWEKVEPEKGKFNWKELDEAMKIAHDHHFADEDMVFNTFGVPRWASSRPKDNRMKQSGIRNYKNCIPADLKDYENFLLELHKRYPKVRTYELWNEPHFPGYSIFWNDTPENHIKLMKAGYECLKKADPSLTIWWAGLSARYLEFYKKILSLGGGKYFDVLSIHGTWQDYESFSKLERAAGIGVKPKVNSEWHANLIKPFQSYYPTEVQGSRKAVMGFLHMLRQNIRRVHFFCMFTTGGCELDELAANKKYGRHDPHVSGLFRSKPYTQPRYYAAAWHTFTSLFKGDIQVLDGYVWKVGDQNVEAQLVSSDAGKVLLFWSNSREPMQLPKELRAALKGAKVILPDGRPVADAGKLKIAPDYYYIVRDPDMEAVAGWKNKGNVLKPFEMSRPLNVSVKGFYRPAPIFDKNMTIISEKTLHFMPFRKEIACYRNAPVGQAAAEFAAGLNENGLDLLVRVKDPVHHPHIKSPDFWDGDSLQFAIDTLQKGRVRDNLELGASWSEQKGAVLWKTSSPHLDGDLPDRYTPPNNPVLQYGKIKFIRKGDLSEYRIHIEPTELYSFVYSPGCRFRISMLVNCSTKYRDSYLEWGSGIGNEKDPTLQGTLTVQVPDKPLFIQSDLNRRNGKDIGNGVWRVETKSDGADGVATGTKAIPGGSSYTVSFEARGNDKLILMVSGKGVKRIDPFKHWQPLSNDWKEFKADVDFPASAQNANFFFFYWNKPGKWFEIRNFKVVPR
ncbi:MAG: beta-galactosidase [Lentisphaeria bacterium]|nr:beta-galactosidase [Lentisphaeria bacterium]